ncbi:MAG: chorismate mutase [Clostridiales bacterium]|nr:chorismate mutase [Clostridiales bacterium]
MMVRAIRGATTVRTNGREEILEATSELLRRMVEENGIDREDIISVSFTATRDLDAVFPAVAARQEMGWTDIALSCTNEMHVPGSLPMCIRATINFNTEKKNSELRYVYLREAIVLRPDLK